MTEPVSLSPGAANPNQAEAVVEAIESSGSKAIGKDVPKAIAIQVDVRKLEEVRSLFEEAIAQWQTHQDFETMQHNPDFHTTSQILEGEIIASCSRWQRGSLPR